MTEVVVATKWLIRRDPQNQRHAKFQKSSWLQTPKPLPSNSDTVFDAEVLSRASRVGQKNSRSEKSETACAQGDPAGATFFVQRGRLRVTLISANGKEGTIALVGAGEFLGEDCLIPSHPLRLATATAMIECAMLRISKAEMVRILHQEHAFARAQRFGFTDYAR